MAADVSLRPGMPGQGQDDLTLRHSYDEAHEKVASWDDGMRHDIMQGMGEGPGMPSRAVLGAPTLEDIAAWRETLPMGPSFIPVKGLYPNRNPGDSMEMDRWVAESCVVTWAGWLYCHGLSVTMHHNVTCMWYYRNGMGNPLIGLSSW